MRKGHLRNGKGRKAEMIKRGARKKRSEKRKKRDKKGYQDVGVDTKGIVNG